MDLPVPENGAFGVVGCVQCGESVRLTQSICAMCGGDQPPWWRRASVWVVAVAAISVGGALLGAPRVLSPAWRAAARQTSSLARTSDMVLACAGDERYTELPLVMTVMLSVAPTPACWTSWLHGAANARLVGVSANDDVVLEMSVDDGDVVTVEASPLRSWSPRGHVANAIRLRNRGAKPVKVVLNFAY
jgi:hypothetical protein